LFPNLSPPELDAATLKTHLQAAFTFISEVGQTQVNSVAQIRDGVVLCKLVNNVRPDTIKNINEGGAKFKLAENITAFVSAARFVRALRLFFVVDRKVSHSSLV
jgi:hypothetical protein